MARLLGSCQSLRIIMKAQKIKQKWYLMPKEFKIYENNNLFSEEGIKFMPCRIFINIKTGEMRFYSKVNVEELGTDAILLELNLKA